MDPDEVVRRLGDHGAQEAGQAPKGKVMRHAACLLLTAALFSACARSTAAVDGGTVLVPHPQTGAMFTDGGVVYYIPDDGFVPDREAAIRIAEAAWIPIYGWEQINSERPFHAELKGDVWFVSGSMHCENCVGGVAEAEIAKADGRIIRVIHGQ
jgi:hypothetical protein